MKSLSKIFKQNNVLFVFLSSHIIMLIIPLVASILSYIPFVQILQNQLETYNITLLGQAQKSLDEKFLNLKQLALNVSLDPPVQGFVYVKPDYANNTNYDLYKVVTALNKYKNTNKMIDEMYIYYPNSKYIITNTSKFTPEFYYQSTMKFNDISMDEWINMLNQRSEVKFYPSQTIVSETKTKKVLLFMHTLQQGYQNQSLATLGITVDQSVIANVFNSITNINGSSIAIYDSKNTRIMSFGNEKLFEQIEKNKNFNDNDKTYEKINNEKYLITTVASDNYQQWKYVMATPSKVVMQQLNIIKFVYLFIMLIMLLIGIYLAYILAKISSNPIRTIASTLQKRLNIDNSDHLNQNEIEFINLATLEAFEKSEKASSILYTQTAMLRSNVALQLIRGNTKAIDSMEQSMEFINFSFIHPNYYTILIHVNEYMENTAKEHNIIKIAITNIIEELAGSKSIALVADIDTDDLAVIVNTSNDEENYLITVSNISLKIIEVLRDYFSTSISISISNMSSSIEDITELYKQASSAMQYILMREHQSIIFYSETTGYLNKSTDATLYPYTLENELKLINNLKLGNIENAQEIFDEIFNVKFNTNNMSLDMIRCQFIDVVSTIIKFLSESQIDINSVFNYNYSPIQELTSCQSISDMKTVISNMLIKTCSYVKSNIPNSSNKLITKIMEYINENFSNHSMSLSSVSEAFHITPVYLSQLFKRHYGDKFSNYVNSLRLEETKRLLVETTLPLNDIALNVGYVNSTVLIRNFKKHLGITPGEYRNSKE